MNDSGLANVTPSSEFEFTHFSAFSYTFVPFVLVKYIKIPQWVRQENYEKTSKSLNSHENTRFFFNFVPFRTPIEIADEIM